MSDTSSSNRSLPNIASDYSSVPDSQSMDTGRLIHRANAGDFAAFDELIFHVSSRLCAIVHRMFANYPHVRRWEETDDVLQEVLVRLQRALKQVKPDSVGHFFGLAATIVRRTLIDLARHYYGVYGMGTKHKSAELVEGRADAVVPEDLRFAESSMDLEDWTAFHEAIERLPHVEKETFSLQWYAGLTQRQIGDLLGISERTVIRRMNRARILLSDQLADHESKT
jgi:RNA polymerase sigma factor (sigma-70 family)